MRLDDACSSRQADQLVTCDQRVPARTKRKLRPQIIANRAGGNEPQTSTESDDTELSLCGRIQQQRSRGRLMGSVCKVGTWPMLLLYTCLTLLNLFATPVGGIAIDNDVIGEPEIECLEEEIRFWVRTRKFFAGRIYAKGKVDVPGCLKSDYSTQRTNEPHWDIKFGNCGMKSLRSLDPRGMYYGITVVVSFHPLFITKVDQAFHVKCFFEEAQRGLTAELGVSMIPTTEVQAKHEVPGCSYSMHKSTIAQLDAGQPAGEPVKFARVGDKVLHQWACDDPMFGVLINNCYVTDGFGQRAEVIDARGCPIDPILITGIRYSSDLQRAYAESHVFKFADKPGVWFFCQIQMCMKGAGMCQGITPPVCDGSGGGPVGGYVPPGNGNTGDPNSYGGDQTSAGGGTSAYGVQTPVPGNGQTGGASVYPTYPNSGGGGGLSAQPLTPFGPAYPPPDGSTGNGYAQVDADPLEEPAAGIDVLIEQNDVPGVSFEGGPIPPSVAVLGGGNGIDSDINGENSVKKKELELGELLEAMPPGMNMDQVKDFFLQHKADQKFLQNAVFKARNTPEEERADFNFDDNTLGDVQAAGPVLADDPGNPEIAGQLIIFDLDEDPPSFLQADTLSVAGGNGTILSEVSPTSGSSNANGRLNPSPHDPDVSTQPANYNQNCVVSPRGLVAIVSALGGVAALFMFVACALGVRQCRGGGKGDRLMDEFEQKALPYDKYPRSSPKRPSHDSPEDKSRHREHKSSRDRHHKDGGRDRDRSDGRHHHGRHRSSHHADRR